MPSWNPAENPEFFDYVVYNMPMVGRPNRFQIEQDKIPFSSIRWNEHMRIPYPDLKERVDAAFAGAEERGSSH
jgi:hypothetical protein